MAQNPLIFIIQTLGEMYVFIVVLRFLLQMAHADYYNPISQAIAKITNIPVLPVSRAVPRVMGVDISALLVALIVKMIVILLLLTLAAKGVPNLIALLLYSAIGVINTLLTIYYWAIIASVIISWIAPGSYHPGPQLIQQLTEPVFKLARKVIPPIGGLDLSPILIFMVIILIQSQLSRLVI